MPPACVRKYVDLQNACLLDRFATTRGREGGELMPTIRELTAMIETYNRTLGL